MRILTGSLLLLCLIASPAQAASGVKWPGSYLLKAPRGVAKKCMGAASMDPQKPRCAKYRFVKKTVVPQPGGEAVNEMLFEVYTRAEFNALICQGEESATKKFPAVADCRIGAPLKKAKRQVALIGDSHSAHWRPAMDRLGKKYNIAIHSLYASGCDFTILERYWGDEQGREYCLTWRKQIAPWLRAHPKVDSAFMASVSKGGDGEIEAAINTWQTLPSSIKQIVAIRDNPVMLNPDCVSEASAKGQRPGLVCAMDRSFVLGQDASLDAAQELAAGNQSGDRRYYGVDLSELICSEDKCYPVVGGLLVLASGAHQSPRFNLTLAPYLEGSLKQQGFPL